MLLVHLIYLGERSSFSAALSVDVWSVLWYLDETLSACLLPPASVGMPALLSLCWFAVSRYRLGLFHP